MTYEEVLVDVHIPMYTIEAMQLGNIECGVLEGHIKTHETKVANGAVVFDYLAIRKQVAKHHALTRTPWTLQEKMSGPQDLRVF